MSQYRKQETGNKFIIEVSFVRIWLFESILAHHDQGMILKTKYVALFFAEGNLERSLSGKVFVYFFSGCPTLRTS
jgi:hypothetical protein